MKKSYYCTFGTNMTEEEVVEILNRKFDMEFVPHESSYVGDYLKYSGLYADALTIEKFCSDRLNSSDEIRFAGYSILLRLSNTEGKNADKLSKTTYFKNHMKNCPAIVLLEEKIYEEPIIPKRYS